MALNLPEAPLTEGSLDDPFECFCLGPPCEHFPEWVKTQRDAIDWLNHQTLQIDPYRGKK